MNDTIMDPPLSRMASVRQSFRKVLIASPARTRKQSSFPSEISDSTITNREESEQQRRRPSFSCTDSTGSFQSSNSSNLTTSQNTSATGLNSSSNSRSTDSFDTASTYSTAYSSVNSVANSVANSLANSSIRATGVGISRTRSLYRCNATTSFTSSPLEARNYRHARLKEAGVAVPDEWFMEKYQCIGTVVGQAASGTKRSKPMSRALKGYLALPVRMHRREETNADHF